MVLKTVGSTAIGTVRMHSMAIKRPTKENPGSVSSGEKRQPKGSRNLNKNSMEGWEINYVRHSCGLVF